MATDLVGMAATHEQSSGNKMVWAILALLGLYTFALLAGLPQQATSIVVAEAAHHGTGAGHPVPSETHAASHAPPYWTVVPFVLLLAAIAVFPLMDLTEEWWERNVNRFKVAACLGVITLAYYALLHESPVEAHWPAHRVVEPTDAVVDADLVVAILGNAILAEFIPFIVLLFSLYTIAGGIRIEGNLQANSLTNAAFMGVGGLLASFVGTTGAAMLLIRPLLETNTERKHVKHTVIFFIFIVCNCGGCLLPIGDPPLFLGYLEGVGFTWTLGLWREWLFVNGLLLLVYCLVDQFYFYPQESLEDINRDIIQSRKLRIRGLLLNGPLLLCVVLAVAFLDPHKSIPGTDWHSWMYLREAVQLGLVAISLYLGSQIIREKNNFNYHAIVEVAALFVGIFICMQPALQLLAEKGSILADTLSPVGFFWTTGTLSSFLDNAPTYLVFFKAAQIPGLGGITAGVPEMVLRGIALGAVFMGAMTYIGNGPNFMVKAIAEKSGVKMPSFFGYMAYSCAVLLPLLALTNYLYLSRSDVPAVQEKVHSERVHLGSAPAPMFEIAPAEIARH